MTARRALLSVYRKEGVVDLARGLTESRRYTVAPPGLMPLANLRS